MLGKARWAVVCLCALALGCSGAAFSSAGDGADAGGGTGGASAGSGGSAAGGTAGTSTGGTSTGGASGGGGTGGAPMTAQPQCVSPGDCTLHSDCCNCVALASSQPPPSCNLTCPVGKCPANTQLKCAFGQCSTDLVCDVSKVGTVCQVAHPTCPNGQVVSVNTDTDCWGPCVRPSDCLTISDCSLCAPGEVCVEYYDQGTLARRRCVNVPPPCQTHRDCTCLGPGVCAGSQVTCSGTGTGLRCDFNG